MAYHYLLLCQSINCASSTVMPLTLPCALGRVNVSSYWDYFKLLLACTIQHKMKIKKGKETNRHGRMESQVLSWVSILFCWPIWWIVLYFCVDWQLNTKTGSAKRTRKLNKEVKEKFTIPKQVNGVVASRCITKSYS